VSSDADYSIIKVRNQTGKYIWKIKEFTPTKPQEQFSAEISATKEPKQVIPPSKDDLGCFIDQILNGTSCKNVISKLDTKIHYQGRSPYQRAPINYAENKGNRRIQQERRSNRCPNTI
jgi:hypothetical protein